MGSGYGVGGLDQGLEEWGGVIVCVSCESVVMPDSLCR